jgi:hypothetical protein
MMSATSNPSPTGDQLAFAAQLAGRDRLLLVRPDFEDPAFPGQRFYCWYSALIEGVLQAFPELALRFDVERMTWSKAAQRIADFIRPQPLTLPLLLLAKGEWSAYQTGIVNAQAFVSETENIMAALADRHGFPNPYPGRYGRSARVVPIDGRCQRSKPSQV